MLIIAPPTKKELPIENSISFALFKDKSAKDAVKVRKALKFGYSLPPEYVKKARKLYEKGELGLPFKRYHVSSDFHDPAMLPLKSHPEWEHNPLYPREYPRRISNKKKNTDNKLVTVRRRRRLRRYSKKRAPNALRMLTVSTKWQKNPRKVSMIRKAMIKFLTKIQTKSVDQSRMEKWGITSSRSQQIVKKLVKSRKAPKELLKFVSDFQKSSSQAGQKTLQKARSFRDMRLERLSFQSWPCGPRTKNCDDLSNEEEMLRHLRKINHWNPKRSIRRFDSHTFKSSGESLLPMVEEMEENGHALDDLRDCKECIDDMIQLVTCQEIIPQLVTVNPITENQDRADPITVAHLEYQHPENENVLKNELLAVLHLRGKRTPLKKLWCMFAFFEINGLCWTIPLAPFMEMHQKRITIPSEETVRSFQPSNQEPVEVLKVFLAQKLDKYGEVPKGHNVFGYFSFNQLKDQYLVELERKADELKDAGKRRFKSEVLQKTVDNPYREWNKTKMIDQAVHEQVINTHVRLESGYSLRQKSVSIIDFPLTYREKVTLEFLGRQRREDQEEANRKKICTEERNKFRAKANPPKLKDILNFPIDEGPYMQFLPEGEVRSTQMSPKMALYLLDQLDKSGYLPSQKQAEREKIMANVNQELLQLAIDARQKSETDQIKKKGFVEMQAELFGWKDDEGASSSGIQTLPRKPKNQKKPKARRDPTKPVQSVPEVPKEPTSTPFVYSESDFDAISYLFVPPSRSITRDEFRGYWDDATINEDNGKEAYHEEFRGANFYDDGYWLEATLEQGYLMYFVCVPPQWTGSAEAQKRLKYIKRLIRSWNEEVPWPDSKDPNYLEKYENKSRDRDPNCYDRLGYHVCDCIPCRNNTLKPCTGKRTKKTNVIWKKRMDRLWEEAERMKRTNTRRTEYFASILPTLPPLPERNTPDSSMEPENIQPREDSPTLRSLGADARAKRKQQAPDGDALLFDDLPKKNLFRSILNKVQILFEEEYLLSNDPELEDESMIDFHESASRVVSPIPTYDSEPPNQASPDLVMFSSPTPVPETVPFAEPVEQECAEPADTNASPIRPASIESIVSVNWQQDDVIEDVAGPITEEHVETVEGSAVEEVWENEEEDSQPAGETAVEPVIDLTSGAFPEELEESIDEPEFEFTEDDLLGTNEPEDCVIEDGQGILEESPTPTTEDVLQEPVAVQVKEPDSVMEPIVEPVVKPIVDSGMNPVIEPVVEPVLEPILNSVIDPVIDPIVDLAMNLVTNPIMEPTIDLIVEPFVEPIVDSVIKPVVESVVEPVVETIVNSVIDPVTEPVMDLVMEPTNEPVTDSIVEPVPEPARDPFPALDVYSTPVNANPAKRAKMAVTDEESPAFESAITKRVLRSAKEETPKNKGGRPRKISRKGGRPRKGEETPRTGIEEQLRNEEETPRKDKRGRPRKGEETPKEKVEPRIQPRRGVKKEEPVIVKQPVQQPKPAKHAVASHDPLAIPETENELIEEMLNGPEPDGERETSIPTTEEDLLADFTEPGGQEEEQFTIEQLLGETDQIPMEDLVDEQLNVEEQPVEVESEAVQQSATETEVAEPVAAEPVIVPKKRGRPRKNPQSTPLFTPQSTPQVASKVVPEEPEDTDTPAKRLLRRRTGQGETTHANVKSPQSSGKPKENTISQEEENLQAVLEIAPQQEVVETATPRTLRRRAGQTAKVLPQTAKSEADVSTEIPNDKDPEALPEKVPEPESETTETPTRRTLRTRTGDQAATPKTLPRSRKSKVEKPVEEAPEETPGVSSADAPEPVPDAEPSEVHDRSTRRKRRRQPSSDNTPTVQKPRPKRVCPLNPHLKIEDIAPERLTGVAMKRATKSPSGSPFKILMRPFDAPLPPKILMAELDEDEGGAVEAAEVVEPIVKEEVPESEFVPPLPINGESRKSKKRLREEAFERDVKLEDGPQPDPECEITMLKIALKQEFDADWEECAIVQANYKIPHKAVPEEMEVPVPMVIAEPAPGEPPKHLHLLLKKVCAEINEQFMSDPERFCAISLILEVDSERLGRVFKSSAAVVNRYSEFTQNFIENLTKSERYLNTENSALITYFDFSTALRKKTSVLLANHRLTPLMLHGIIEKINIIRKTLRESCPNGMIGENERDANAATEAILIGRYINSIMKLTGLSQLAWATEEHVKRRLELIYHGWVMFLSSGGFFKVLLALDRDDVKKISDGFREYATKYLSDIETHYAKAIECSQMSPEELFAKICEKAGVTEEELALVDGDLRTEQSETHKMKCTQCSLGGTSIYFSSYAVVEIHDKFHEGAIECNRCYEEFPELESIMHRVNAHSSMRPDED